MYDNVVQKVPVGHQLNKINHQLSLQYFISLTNKTKRLASHPHSHKD